MQAVKRGTPFELFGGAPGRLPKCIAGLLTSDEPMMAREAIPYLQQDAEPIIKQTGWEFAVMSYVVNIPCDMIDIETWEITPGFGHYWRAKEKTDEN